MGGAGLVGVRTVVVLRHPLRMGFRRETAVAAQAFETGRIDSVPESLDRRLTVFGGRQEALSRFDNYRQAGADFVLCYSVATLDPFSSVLGLFSPPRLRKASLLRASCAGSSGG